MTRFSFVVAISGLRALIFIALTEHSFAQLIAVVGSAGADLIYAFERWEER